MSIGPKDKIEDLEITMSKYVKIKCSSDLRLLGLTTDQNLDFSKHVSELCKWAGRKVGVITRLCNLLPTRAKLILHKCGILPQLTYCHTVWNFCWASDNRKLERIQERALRVIYNRKSGTYNELLKLARLPTLRNRRLQDIATLMYYSKEQSVSSVHIKELFRKNNINSYSLRNSDFVIPRFNTVTYSKHSLWYLGPVLWSKLDEIIKNSESLNTLKTKIRKLDLPVVGLIEDNK